MFVGSCNGLVHAIDRRTGQPRWTYNALQDGGTRAEFHGTAVIAEDLVILGSDDRTPNGVGYVYAFERGTGNVRWKFGAGAGVMGDLVRAGDRLYAVTLQDELVCLQLSSGRPLWSFRSGWVNEEMTNVAVAPALVGEHVVFGGQNGIVHSIHARSGQPISKSDVGSRVVTPLVVARDAVYFATADQRLHRMTLGRNPAHSHLALAGIPFGTPTLMEDSILLMSQGDDGVSRLHSIDLEATRVKWTRETEGGWSSSRPYLWRGKALAGSEDGKLVALSRDGLEEWSDTVGAVIQSIGAAGEVLYVGTPQGTIFAYKARP